MPTAFIKKTKQEYGRSALDNLDKVDQIAE